MILQKTNIELVLMRAYRAAELISNVLKNNIEMDIIEMALVCAV